MIIKYTPGYVKQEFNNDGTFIRQNFITTDCSEFENEQNEIIDPVNFYHNFNMKNDQRFQLTSRYFAIYKFCLFCYSSIHNKGAYHECFIIVDE